MSIPLTPQIEDLTKLYTLIVEPDNSYQILVDEEELGKGNLLEDFNPPVNPSKEIGKLFMLSYVKSSLSDPWRAQMIPKIPSPLTGSMTLLSLIRMLPRFVSSYNSTFA